MCVSCMVVRLKPTKIFQQSDRQTESQTDRWTPGNILQTTSVLVPVTKGASRSTIWHDDTHSHRLTKWIHHQPMLQLVNIDWCSLVKIKTAEAISCLWRDDLYFLKKRKTMPPLSWQIFLICMLFSHDSQRDSQNPTLTKQLFCD